MKKIIPSVELKPIGTKSSFYAESFHCKNNIAFYIDSVQDF